jgi:hypothetical protein
MDNSKVNLIFLLYSYTLLRESWHSNGFWKLSLEARLWEVSCLVTAVLFVK